MSVKEKTFFPSRLETRVVQIGDLPVGGKYPIRIQSMTNTNTLDTSATVAQSIRLINAGCEYVRITTPSMKEAENLLLIKKSLRQKKYVAPLIADVHYNPGVAEFLARHVEKIRINPGNYADKKSFKKIDFTEIEYACEIERIYTRFSPLVKICQEHGTAIRIGVNHGSLSDRIMSRFGDTPEGMVESAMDFIRICRDHNFHNIVLSMKASNPLIMVNACRLLVVMMNKQKMNYPLHLGVTEAGEGDDGRIRSAIGIGALLEDGIGDTIRVSLTENPENEIPFAKLIADRYNNKKTIVAPTKKSYTTAIRFNRNKSNVIGNIGGKNVPVVIAPDQKKPSALQPDYIFKSSKLITKKEINFVEIARKNIGQLHLEKIKEDKTTVIIYTPSGKSIVSELRQFYSLLNDYHYSFPVILKCAYRNLSVFEFLMNSSIDVGALFLDGLCDGLWLENKSNPELALNTSFSILQACRRRISQTEYISCPTCGRTSFNIQEMLSEVKEKTKQFAGLKIAVMGCIVNGPGEMADADYGIVGNANGGVHLYEGKKIIKKNINPKSVIDLMVHLINNRGKS